MRRPTRIDGLDAWRAVLMLGGLPVHGSFWLADAPLFAVVTTVSQAFRMGAFFAIAGFLTARALANRSPAAWLRRRIVQLGIPLIFGLTVLSPLMWLAGTRRPPGAPGALTSPFHWHHLWFLVGLILYSLAAVVLLRLERRNGLIGRLVAVHAHRRLTARAILFAVAVSSVVLMALAQVVLPRGYERSFENAPLIAAYFPLFLLGMTVGREPRLGEAMIAGWREHAIALSLIAAIYIVWFGAAQHSVAAAVAERIGDAIRYGGIALCPTLAFVVILRSSVAIRRVPRLLRDLSEASYTIYLLHLPIIGVVNAQLANVAWHPYVKYAVAILVAGTSSYGLHRYAVRRSRTCALLLNGKTPERRTDVSASLVTG